MENKLEIKQQDIQKVCIIDKSTEILEQSEKDKDIKRQFQINRNTYILRDGLTERQVTSLK